MGLVDEDRFSSFSFLSQRVMELLATMTANNFSASLGFEPPTSDLLDGLTSDYTM